MARAKRGSITLGVIQQSFSDDMDENIARVSGFVREAAKQGADVILPSELFQGHYFCTTQDETRFATAYPWREHPCVLAMQKLAQELEVVIPVSIFEKAGHHYYNSLAVADADGRLH